MMGVRLRGANRLLDHVLLMTDVGGVVRVSNAIIGWLEEPRTLVDLPPRIALFAVNGDRHIIRFMCSCQSGKSSPHQMRRCSKLLSPHKKDTFLTPKELGIDVSTTDDVHIFSMPGLHLGPPRSSPLQIKCPK